MDKRDHDLAWSDPVDLDDREPQDPYAHWLFTRCPGAASAGFVALTGTDLAALSVERVKAGAAPVGDQSGVPADGRLTPVGMLPADVLNDIGDAPADRETCVDEAAAVAARAIVGIVDDGTAFAHERFRCGGKTRFDWLWLQGVPDRGLGAAGRQPFGCEFARENIDKMLKKFAFCGPDGVPSVDEEALYRHVGLIDPRRPDAMRAAAGSTHGTAVLDEAAGFDPTDPKAKEVVLVGVTLPEQITQDTSGAIMDLFLILGVCRILQRADTIQKVRSDRSLPRIPVLINLSVSVSAGPKAGDGLFERFVAAAIAAHPEGVFAPLRVFVPTGNHRDGQIHARLDPNGAEEEQTLTWRVLPDDRTPSFLEIWLDAETVRPDAPLARIELAPPGAPGAADHAARPRFGSFLDLGAADTPAARAYYSWHPSDLAKPCGPGRQRIVLVVPPTETDEAGENVGPAGDWIVRLVTEAGNAACADVYAQRDDTLTGGRRRGRQSYFVDPKYLRYDETGRQVVSPDGDEGAVRRYGTINAFGTGSGITSVAGFRWFGACDLWYSGLGRDKATPPKLAAICEESVALRGVLTAAARSGGTAVLAGTSIAAPRALRYEMTRLIGARRILDEQTHAGKDAKGALATAEAELCVAPQLTINGVPAADPALADPAPEGWRERVTVDPEPTGPPKQP